MTTRREEVPNWDSLIYINFIVAVEIELGIKFKVADVESFANVGEIVATARTMLK
jgi:acyl carrier protein